MNVKDIILDKIESVGADGLRHPRRGCECGKHDLLEECQLNPSSCVLAKLVSQKEFCEFYGWKTCDGCSPLGGCNPAAKIRYIPIRRYIPIDGEETIK